MIILETNQLILRVFVFCRNCVCDGSDFVIVKHFLNKKVVTSVWITYYDRIITLSQIVSK